MTDIHRSALRYTADITVQDIDALAGFIDRRIALLREADGAPGGEEERVGGALAQTVAALHGSAREVLGALAVRAAAAAAAAREAGGGPAGAGGAGEGVRYPDEVPEELMVRLSTLWRYLLTAAEAWSHLPDYDVARWRLDGHLDAEHEARARWQEAGQAW
ncbi:hypothetical protein ACFCX4_19390 [Kitasatospora sp. NPDC056327]|uniref:hypothetical protein n=1 Tax=Kitasatospora sp. NPDC056327 TaxID=3345785 RepID=UPI0035E00476